MQGSTFVGIDETLRETARRNIGVSTKHCPRPRDETSAYRRNIARDRATKHRRIDETLRERGRGGLWDWTNAVAVACGIGRNIGVRII